MKIRKKQKLKGIFILFLFVILVSLNFVSADFVIGNLSYNIEREYGPSDIIKGWINISLKNEPADSLLTAFNSSINIKDFLDNNSADYSCYPLDCQFSYSLNGSGANSKTFFLKERKTKLFGVKLVGEVSGINNLIFNVSTNAGKSCLNPIKIDILGDNSYEWKAEKVSNDFSCYIEKPFGCYDGVNLKDTNITDNTLYCQKINLPPVKGFLVGAKISGTGKADFKISTDIGEIAECLVSINGSNEINCTIEFDDAPQSFTDADVCVIAENLYGNKYKINYEDNEPCGYSEVNNEKFSHDFEIFAKPAKYSAVQEFKFDKEILGEENTLVQDIVNYIDEKYNKNCTPECVVPIGFYAGIDQEITIYNLKAEYSVKGLSASENKIFDITKTVPLINSKFQKLRLEKANLLTPSVFGAEELVLKIGGKEILKENIAVKKVPEIIAILPDNPPALVPVKFLVLLKDKNATNLIYSWDFGDKTPEQTSDKNIIEHTYSKIGSYNLTVKISNNLGEASKSVVINAVAPKEAINRTIKQYKDDLRNVRARLNDIPAWIREEIYKKVDLDELESEVSKQEAKYKEAILDEEHIKIMEDLLKLKIPSNLTLDYIVESGNFIMSEEQLNLEVLDNLGAGSFEEEKKDYFNGINNWLRENLNVVFESRTYLFDFGNGESEILFSYVKMILSPEDNLEYVYFVVNGDPAKITFNGDWDAKDVGESAVGIIFPELTETKTIEFLYPGKIDFLNLPVYISPESKNIDIGFEPGVCNNNGKCEKSSGENYKNCRSDCKPWGWTMFLLFLLLFGALVVYIILQEWYKRHYEYHLFKDKNQLFNLIHFMHNSLNQGIKKAEIFSELKELDWNSEQLNYAWNKLHGKRTGMWEIPVFKWVENKRVKKELEKRTEII